MRAASIGTALLVTLGAGTWVMSTDELDAFASALVHQVKTVKTSEPVVFVVVRAPAGDAAAVARRLAADDLAGSIATVTVPGSAALRVINLKGDQSIPTIRRAGLLGWIHTSSILRRDARALHLHHRFYYLEPHGETFGQLLLARTAGGVPVRGSVALGSGTRLSGHDFSKGDVVVVTLSGTGSSYGVLDRLADALASDGLVGLPLSALGT
jgi:hypothetical protein